MTPVYEINTSSKRVKKKKREKLNMSEKTIKTTSGHYIVETVVEVVSLRDQFAMAALPGLIGRIGRSNTSSDVSKVAYELADAMLEARKEKNDRQI